MNNIKFLFLVAAVTVVQVFGYPELTWKRIPDKIISVGSRMKQELYLKWARARHIDWQWVVTSVRNVSSTCREEIAEMAFLDKRDWVFLKRRDAETIPVPGGLCPKIWPGTYGTTKVVSQSHLLLTYWFKWPGSKMRVKLKTDLKYRTDDCYLERIKIAIQSSMQRLVEEFVVLGCNFEKKKGFWEKVFPQ